MYDNVCMFSMFLQQESIYIYSMVSPILSTRPAERHPPGENGKGIRGRVTPLNPAKKQKGPYAAYPAHAAACPAHSAVLAVLPMLTALPYCYLL